MSRFTIRNRWTNAVIHEGDFATMRECVEAAIKDGASLYGASLVGANLVGASLVGASLYGANLARADLAGADLARADLAGADLARASLVGASLVGASLYGASLVGANLVGASLYGANLARAYLAGANLARAIWRDGFRLNRAPVRTAQRSDGYTFYLLDTDHGWMIAAGCRFFTPDEAWAHWERTRPGDGPRDLGAETRDILTMFELAMEREANS